MRNEEKVNLPPLNERKETDHLPASGISKKESPLERRTEMVSPNNVLFIEDYRPSRPTIEKPVPSRKDHEGTQSGSSDIINLRSAKDKQNAIKSQGTPAVKPQSTEKPALPENQPVFADDRARIAWEIGPDLSV